MKSLMRTALAATALLMLGGCVYGPGYYQRPGVVYDDGAAVTSEPGYYADSTYYGGPGYYESGYQPAYGGCHVERQQFEDPYGRIHVRRVRVCD